MRTKIIILAIAGIILIGGLVLFGGVREREVGPISLEDVKNNPENYLGERQVAFTITNIELTNITDWYGNKVEVYKVTIKDDYNYESSFYISKDDYQNYSQLIGTKQFFELIGKSGPYYESHVVSAINQIVYEPFPDYSGAWSVNIRLIK
jgi:hypothetical protein